MTRTELNTLAHQIAYATSRADIESFTQWRDDRVDAPVESSFMTPAHRWHDLSTVIRDDFEREAVAQAIFYLDARSLLRRKPSEPFLVQILPPLSNGELMPPTLAEALSA
ncbi:hypothetical protein B0E46_15635 [Rhodanobacter sp. B04]|uniref:hypothetical protein n=1 Tax=Rhodanobacter sp. B04 TaxID=1945860 RepID=UPI0009856454|nr:hypothetical protein [Rhodanobacter sp. B04]OOG61409.1 hypothetical protein B0E46_15635 [Rhodanobacter sp. B04]